MVRQNKFQCSVHPEFETNSKKKFLEHIKAHVPKLNPLLQNLSFCDEHIRDHAMVQNDIEFARGMEKLRNEHFKRHQYKREMIEI